MQSRGQSCLAAAAGKKTAQQKEVVSCGSSFKLIYLQPLVLFSLLTPAVHLKKFYCCAKCSYQQRTLSFSPVGRQVSAFSSKLKLFL